MCLFLKMSHHPDCPLLAILKIFSEIEFTRISKERQSKTFLILFFSSCSQRPRRLRSDAFGRSDPPKESFGLSGLGTQHCSVIEQSFGWRVISFPISDWERNVQKLRFNASTFSNSLSRGGGRAWKRGGLLHPRTNRSIYLLGNEAFYSYFLGNECFLVLNLEKVGRMMSLNRQNHSVPVLNLLAQSLPNYSTVGFARNSKGALVVC